MLEEGQEQKKKEWNIHESLTKKEEALLKKIINRKVSDRAIKAAFIVRMLCLIVVIFVFLCAVFSKLKNGERSWDHVVSFLFIALVFFQQIVFDSVLRKREILIRKIWRSQELATKGKL